MKLTINSRELLKAMQTVGSLIKPQNTMPALDNILFELKPGKLFLTADNLEVRSTIEVDVAFDTEYSTCVPFAYFSNILKGFPDTPVDVIFNKNNVEIVSATGRYKIPIVPSDVKAYPTKNKPDIETSVTFNSLDIVEAIKKAYHFADKSNADSLSTVLFWIDEDCTRVAGCTKHVFFETSIDVKGSHAKLLLSLSTAQYLTTSIASEEDVEISYNSNNIYFKLDKREISAVLHDAKYPNYDVTFSKISSNKSFTVNKDYLLPALKRIINITDKNSYAILFNFDKDKLVMNFSHSITNTEAQESLEADYTGDALSIGLNANNLNSILNAVDGEITMEMSTEMMPCFIRAENTRCLVTPMKL